MDAQKCKINHKLAPKRDLDADAQNKIIFDTRQQQQHKKKQPAQERLKRLQTNLKQITSKKADKETKHVQRRSPRKSYTSTAVSTSSSAAAATATSKYQQAPRKASFRQSGFPNKPKAASSKCNWNANSPSKDAWAKPIALVDASNRLESNHSINANQRLALLRESLQQHQKQTNNNNQSTNSNNNYKNNNKSNNIYSCDAIMCNKKLTVITAPKSTKTAKIFQLEPPANDEVQPMDIDWEEEKQVEKGKQQHSGTNCNIVEQNSDRTLLRLLSNGEQLPARLEDHMYFVLDTNVLLDNLVFVEDLSRLALGKTQGSMLYIPYIVIKELDKLKDRRANDEFKRKVAIRAIRYLNNKFDNSLKIQGQSAMEESEHLIDVDCPDDSIVNCCLQLKDQVTHLMLLTNDNNLRLKANASHIKVSCRSDLMNDYRESFDRLPSL